MRKQWKLKSLYYMGKAEFSRQNYTEAIKYFTMRLELAKKLPNIENKDIDENIVLINNAVALEANVKQKEKNMYQNAFKAMADNSDGNTSPKRSAKKNTKAIKNAPEDNNGNDYSGYIIGGIIATVLVGAFIWLRSRK